MPQRRSHPASPPRIRRHFVRWAIGLVLLIGTIAGGWEWSTARCLARARDELQRNPVRAEEIAAEATLNWSLQRETAWIVRGRCCLAAGAIPEAYGCWSNAARPNRASQDDLLALADAALSIREWRLAEWANAAAERSNLNRRTWLTQRLMLSIHDHKWDRVAIEADELIPLAGDHGPSWLAVADAHFTLSRFPLAAEAFRRAADAQATALTEEHRRELTPRWAQLLIDLGEFDAAAPLVAIELASQPNDAAALRRQATILRSQGNTGEALAAIEVASRLGPDDERVAVLHATLLVDSGKNDEAVVILRRLIERKPYLPEPRHRYALLLRQQQNLEAAVLQEQEAQRLSQLQRDLLNGQAMWSTEKSPQLAAEIARILQQLGRIQEASEWERLTHP